MTRTFLAIAVGIFAASQTQEGPIMANKGLEIPEDQIEATQAVALSGSGPAAFKLFDYYEMVAVDKEKSLYWATISAENNYPKGMYALGFKLARERDYKAKIRARYWLEKAKKNGETLANDILKELDKSE